MQDDRIDLNDRIALRPNEAAATLGVSDRTLRKWMRDDRLPYMRLDRCILIPVAELKEWIRDRTEQESTADELAAEILADLDQPS